MFNMEMYHTHIATVATEIQDLLCFCPFVRTVASEFWARCDCAMISGHTL